MNFKFIPGETYVPVSGKVFNHEEIDNAITAARDGWWTEGRWWELLEILLPLVFTRLINYVWEKVAL